MTTHHRWRTAPSLYADPVDWSSGTGWCPALPVQLCALGVACTVAVVLLIGYFSSAWAIFEFNFIYEIPKERVEQFLDWSVMNEKWRRIEEKKRGLHLPYNVTIRVQAGLDMNCNKTILKTTWSQEKIRKMKLEKIYVNRSSEECKARGPAANHFGLPTVVLGTANPILLALSLSPKFYKASYVAVSTITLTGILTTLNTCYFAIQKSTVAKRLLDLGLQRTTSHLILRDLQLGWAFQLWCVATVLLIVDGPIASLGAYCAYSSRIEKDQHKRMHELRRQLRESVKSAVHPSKTTLTPRLSSESANLNSPHPRARQS